MTYNKLPVFYASSECCHYVDKKNYDLKHAHKGGLSLQGTQKFGLSHPES